MVEKHCGVEISVTNDLSIILFYNNFKRKCIYIHCFHTPTDYSQMAQKLFIVMTISCDYRNEMAIRKSYYFRFVLCKHCARPKLPCLQLPSFYNVWWMHKLFVAYFWVFYIRNWSKYPLFLLFFFFSIFRQPWT